jgi:hypothetical protein
MEPGRNKIIFSRECTQMNMNHLRASARLKRQVGDLPYFAWTWHENLLF